MDIAPALARLRDQVNEHVFKSGTFRFSDFVGHVDHEFENWESQGFRWVGIDEMPSPLHSGAKAFMPALRKYEKGLKP